MSTLASINANSRRLDLNEELAFMSSPLSSVTSITYEQATQLLKVATPVTCPYTDVNGKIIQLWKYHESLVASLLEGKKITLFPGENVCNSLNPSEKGEALLRRLESSSLKQWNFSYLPERSRISVCPFLATGISSRNEVLPEWSLQTQNQMRKIQILENENTELRLQTQHKIRQLKIVQDEQRELLSEQSTLKRQLKIVQDEQRELLSEQVTLERRISYKGEQISDLLIEQREGKSEQRFLSDRINKQGEELIALNARLETADTDREALRSEQATLKRRITNLEIATADNQRRLDEMQKEMITSRAERESLRSEQATLRERITKQKEIMASHELSLIDIKSSHKDIHDSCDSIQRRIEEFQSLFQEMNEKWTNAVIDLKDQWRKDTIDTKEEYRQFLIDTKEEWRKDSLLFRRELESIENETLKKDSFDTEQYLESLLISSKPKKSVSPNKILSHEKVTETIKPLPEIISPKKVQPLEIPSKSSAPPVQTTNWTQILKTISLLGVTIVLGSYIAKSRKWIRSS